MCQKKFEELNLCDDFMFGKVMRNKAICKKTLEIRLNQLLAGQNRTEDIIRAAQDTEYQQKLFEEFHSI